MQTSGNQRTLWIGAVAAAFLVGLVIGWMVIGWNVAPVQWVDADPPDLREHHKEAYVLMAADSFALTGDAGLAAQRLQNFTGDELAPLIGRLLRSAPDTDSRERLNRLAEVRHIVPAEDVSAKPAAEETGKGTGLLSGRLTKLLVGLVLVLVVGGGAVTFRRLRGGGRAPSVGRVISRPAQDRGGFGRAAPVEAGDTTPAAVSPFRRERAAPPASSLGNFATTYKLGDDGYDTSFSIETPAGEFLGECGIGISEILDEGPPQKVTAFEIWLFDKNDIRTVTKVLMSEHAYNDPSLTAKLKPKGDLIIAQPNELLILETASLRVQVQTVEMDYGWESNLPPRSYFENLVVEMTPTAKDSGELPTAA